MSLNSYITATRRLLHDANGRVWSTSELTDYINEGRKRVAVDTHCLRSLENVAFLTSTETYLLSTATTKLARAFDLKNLTVLWGSQRVPMEWYPWTQFNALYRPWTINLSRPCVWSFYGSNPTTKLIYVQPVPDQAYTAQGDLFYFPVDLASDSDTDELSYPFTDPVPYYAASKAKESEQSYGEAQQFLTQYAKKALEAINSFTAYYQSAYR